MMNVPKKEHELLLRVFKLIAGDHFNDHKMISTYCNKIDFDRNLGDDIANYMQSRNPEYYHKKRKENDEECDRLRNMIIIESEERVPYTPHVAPDLNELFAKWDKYVWGK